MDSVWSLSHVRLFVDCNTPGFPCPSPTPGAYSNSCPSSWWYHPAISSSVVPFSFCLQSFPAAGSFPMSQFFISGGQSTGVSSSASVLPMNIQDWYPLGWTGWISCSPRDSQESSPNHSSKASILQCSTFFIVQLSHPHMTTGNMDLGNNKRYFCVLCLQKKKERECVEYKTQRQIWNPYLDVKIED